MDAGAYPVTKVDILKPNHNLRSRTTEAQLGLVIEFARETELEFEIHFELGLAFDPEFESSSS